MNRFYPRPMNRPNPYIYNQIPRFPVGMNQPPQQGASGFLTKLLGQANSGSINLEAWLNGIQKTLTMAEKFTPMIQQYGPLVKSAPALIQLLKDTSDSNSSDETTTKESNEDTEEKPQTLKKTNKVVKPKESVPKLYI